MAAVATSLLIGVFALVLAAAERASAARDPAARCAAGKIKATGKKTQGKLKCEAKAVGKNDPVDAGCLAKVEEQFAGAFEKVDDKGGCVTTNDAAALESEVDGFVADVLAALPDGGTDDGRKCAAAKIKATGKKAAGKLKCHTKAVAKGRAPDPDCLAKVEAKLASVFMKAEGKGGCATVGDAETIEGKVNVFVGAVLGALSGATTTTTGTTTTITTITGTTSSTTSTTAPAVSFSGQVQPIFNARCALSGCHSGAFPTGGLDLSAGVAHGNLVDQPSSECPSFKRVAPGAPDSSYIIFKLQGSGTCFVGVQMPFGGPPLSAAEIDTIRTWIAQGAANN
jgi:hypothetical protein